MTRYLLAAAAMIAGAGSAQAAVIDGTIAAGEYSGAFVTNVPYQANATGDFSTFAQGSSTSAYTVYYKADATNVYVAMQQNPAGVGLDDFDASVGLTLANIYFNGIGFEVFNDRAFRPGGDGSYYYSLTGAGASYAKTDATSYAAGGTPGVIEIALPWSIFTQNTLGVGQGYAGVAKGGNLQLRISQSLGYAPTGGDYMDNSGVARFGTLVAPVPEPATWATMILGMGLIGGVLRRRRAAAATPSPA